MAEITFQNCEQAISYMLQYIRLSRVDFKFLDSITKNGVRQNTVTTNQVELFKKVVHKYRKQLEKIKLHTSDIISLPWHCKIIPSSPAYTEAYISIEDNIIKLKAPYNKNFIVATRKEPIHSLQWNKEERLYTAEYSTNTFKNLYLKVKDNFNKVNYCPVSDGLLQKVKQFNDVAYWNPYLVYKNDRLFVCAANQNLMDGIEHIPLNLEPQTIADLVFHGISISETVIEKLRMEYPSDFVNFIIDPEPVVEIQKIETIIEWLSALNCDAVYEANKIYRFGEKSNINYYDTLKKHDIPIVKKDNKKTHDRPVSFSYTTFGISMMKPQKVFKSIRFVNSHPVNILQ